MIKLASSTCQNGGPALPGTRTVLYGDTRHRSQLTGAGTVAAARRRKRGDWRLEIRDDDSPFILSFV
jgi:hypothetical protein